MTNRKFLSFLLAIFMVLSTVIPLFAENDSVTVLPPRMAEEEEPQNIVIIEDDKDNIPIFDKSEEGGKEIEETPEESEIEKDNSPVILENREEGDKKNVVILPPIRNEEELEDEETKETSTETNEPEEPKEEKEKKKEVKVQILSKRDVKKPASHGEVSLVLLNDNPADVNEEVYDEKIRWKESDFNIKDDKIISLSDEGLLKAKTNKKLIIPEMENITIIEKEAFKGLSLRSVEIPKNIKEIKDEAFKDNQLKLVKILGKGKEISKNAFNEELVEEYGKCEDEEFLYEYESTDEDELEIGEEIIGDAVGAGTEKQVTIKIVDSFGNPVPEYNVIAGYYAIETTPVYSEDSTGKTEHLIGYRISNKEFKSKKTFTTDSNGQVIVTYEDLGYYPIYPSLFSYNELFKESNQYGAFTVEVDDDIQILKKDNEDTNYFEYDNKVFFLNNFNSLLFRYKATLDLTSLYTFNGNTITGLSDVGKEYYKKVHRAIIPKTTPEGLPVTTIGEEAFSYRKNDEYFFTSIEFENPDTITDIENLAFFQNKLENINLTECKNLKNIGDGAFAQNQLTSIDLSGCLHLEKISSGAFSAK